MASVPDIHEVLSRRLSIIERLAESPATKPELVEQLGSSRSTIDRAMDRLEECNLVCRPANAYELTVVGKLAYESHTDHLAHLSTLERLDHLLVHLPTDVPLSPGIFIGADSQRADPNGPEYVLERLVEMIRDASAVRGVGRVALPMIVDTIHEEVVENDLELEWAVPAGVIELVRENHSGQFTEALETGNLAVRECRRRPEYSVWIVETDGATESGLLVHSETGVHGIITGDTDLMTAWATERFQHHWDRADPYDPR